MKWAKIKEQLDAPPRMDLVYSVHKFQYPGENYSRNLGLILFNARQRQTLITGEVVPAQGALDYKFSLPPHGYGTSDIPGHDVLCVCLSNHPLISISVEEAKRYNVNPDMIRIPKNTGQFTLTQVMRQFVDVVGSRYLLEKPTGSDFRKPTGQHWWTAPVYLAWCRMMYGEIVAKIDNERRVEAEMESGSSLMALTGAGAP
mgnify:CR=1 FL=1